MMGLLPTNINVAAAALVAVAAVVASSLWEVTTFVPTLPPSFDIYSEGYHAHEVIAPSVTSWKLRLAARLLVSSPLGDFLARKLLVKNGVPALVEFADRIQNDVTSGRANGGEFAVGGEPLVRLSDAERDWHVAAAAMEDAAASSRLVAYNQNGPESKSKLNSVYDYHKAYKDQVTTPDQVLSKLLLFINETDPILRCVEYVDRAGAELAAEESTKRWKDGSPLSLFDGIPVLIKPEISVKGVPFTCGLQRPLQNSKLGTFDDIIVARLRKAGAVVVGTTVMHEKGVQPTGYNPWHQGPNNPYGLSRFPGGSSSGSAVAVATGMVPVAIGFDGGGSIRIPASWSGTVGLAGGYGRIPFIPGTKANLFSVIKAGALTATVSDSLQALLLLGEGVERDEGRDDHPYHKSYGGAGPPPPHSKPRWSDDDDRPIQIGVFFDWDLHRPAGRAAGNTGNDDAVVAMFQQTIKALEGYAERKVKIVPFTIPHLHLQALAHGIIISATMSFSNVRELHKGSSKRETPDLHDDLQPPTKIQIKIGSMITALELLACYRIRNCALAQWRQVLVEKSDVILTPTTPMTALKRPTGSDINGLSDSGLFIQMMRFIWSGNLIGLPGLSVPIGADSEGMPVSAQVICAHWHEADCLAIGGLIESTKQEPLPVPVGDLFVDLQRE